MHAIEVSASGGPEVLAYVQRPVPEPAPGQVLIKTEAIGVNVDTYFRTGLASPCNLRVAPHLPTASRRPTAS
jgi:NADPH:quinone reductase-like Zn-dependent oxidoreductase